MAMNLSALMLQVSAAILTSSLCERWNRAMIAAGLMAALFALYQTVILHCLFILINGPAWSSWFHFDKLVYLAAGRSGWSYLTTGPQAVFIRADLVTLAAINLLLCAATLFVSIRFAGGFVTRSWQHEPQSIRGVRWLQNFMKPRFWTGLFRMRLNRALDRNPMGWLHRYSTGARLVPLSLLLTMAVAEAFISVGDPRHAFGNNILLIGIWLLALSFSAAGSFMRERNTGALGLILVSPLSVTRIITGRVFGIWRQFLPGFILIVFCAAVLTNFHARFDSVFYLVNLAAGLPLVMAFLTIPLIGFRFSLSVRHFPVAWLATAVSSFLAPYLIWRISMIALAPIIISPPTEYSAVRLLLWTVALVLVFQTVVACLNGKQLKRILSERSFATRKSSA